MIRRIAPLIVLLWSDLTWAQAADAVPAVEVGAAEPEYALGWLVLLALGPLLAIVATAFAKAAVLLGILRGGLGAPSVLPMPVVLGLATVLALLVMAPVGGDMAAAMGPQRAADVHALTAASSRGWPILERFLVAHTKAADTATVTDAMKPLDPAPDRGERPAARIVAFSISELTAAFQLGVLLLIPFLVVDLLVANTLAVLGFHLLSPLLVALPFKLLLFVAADGWSLFVRGFLGTYT